MQRVVVVGLNQYVVRLRWITIADRAHGRQRRIDRLAHASHDDQLFDGYCLALTDFVRFSGLNLFLFAQRLSFGDFQHAPDFGQAAGFLCDPLAAFDPCAMHRHDFRLMLLEHQTKASSLLEGSNFIRNNLPQIGIGDFGYLIFKASHKFVVFPMN